VDKLIEHVAELACALVRIDTANPPGGEAAAADLIARFLESSGVELQIDRFADSRANLVAVIRGVNGVGGVLLCGHLDTVPANPDGWTFDPHTPTIRDGRLYGRGACDMKGAVAAMAVLLAEVASWKARPSGDLILALTAGEEVDSCGAHRLAETGLLNKVDSIIIGEPTRMDIGIGHKGALWVDVATKGVAAHGSNPAAGVNAVSRMLDWLEPFSEIENLAERDRDELLGNGTVSLNRLSGGSAPNVVPDECHAVLDFRTVSNTAHERILRALGSRSSHATISVLRDSPVVSCDGESPLHAAAIDTIREVSGQEPIQRPLAYITDASVCVGNTSASVLILGPGDERSAHGVDEYVSLQDLTQAAACYLGIVTRLLFGEDSSRGLRP
jgi:succinyl-diaminopimelate desuccinylase